MAKSDSIRAAVEGIDAVREELRCLCLMADQEGKVEPPSWLLPMLSLHRRLEVAIGVAMVATAAVEPKP